MGERRREEGAEGMREGGEVRGAGENFDLLQLRMFRPT